MAWVQIFKNAPILLIFGVMNSFPESFLHTKYEQNRSTFDNAQNFEPNFFDNTEKGQSKFLICCLKKANLPWKRSKSSVKQRALGPIFNRAGPETELRIGHCAQTVGPRSKIFSS